MMVPIALLPLALLPLVFGGLVLAKPMDNDGELNMDNIILQ